MYIWRFYEFVIRRLGKLFFWVYFYSIGRIKGFVNSVYFMNNWVYIKVNDFFRWFLGGMGIIFCENVLCNFRKYF